MHTNLWTDRRAIVVTGASSGIGEACALQLDKAGYYVFAGVRSKVDGATLRSRASERLTPITIDITEPVSIAAALDNVTAFVGEAGLAGLINNAGMVIAGPLEFIPIPEIRRQFESNVTGQIAVTQAFLPLLRQGRGRIIFMGSVGGRVAMPFIGPYTASKFALEALTDSLRMELRAWEIPVILIEPSFIATPLWEKSVARADEMLTNLSPQVTGLYGPALAAVRKIYLRVGKSATPVDTVAKVIIHTLSVARPRTRYTVGIGASLITAVFARLPDRLRDYLIAGVLLNTGRK
jgi:NAD(P)-dependent dehydrogenase (short-subunit alcohol dehydrogenase family)